MKIEVDNNIATKLMNIFKDEANRNKEEYKRKMIMGHEIRGIGEKCLKLDGYDFIKWNDIDYSFIDYIEGEEIDNLHLEIIKFFYPELKEIIEDIIEIEVTFEENETEEIETSETTTEETEEKRKIKEFGEKIKKELLENKEQYRGQELPHGHKINGIGEKYIKLDWDVFLDWRILGIKYKIYKENGVTDIIRAFFEFILPKIGIEEEVSDEKKIRNIIKKSIEQYEYITKIYKLDITHEQLVQNVRDNINEAYLLEETKEKNKEIFKVIYTILQLKGHKIDDKILKGNKLIDYNNQEKEQDWTEYIEKAKKYIEEETKTSSEKDQSKTEEIKIVDTDDLFREIEEKYYDETGKTLSNDSQKRLNLKRSEIVKLLRKGIKVKRWNGEYRIRGNKLIRYSVKRNVVITETPIPSPSNQTTDIQNIGEKAKKEMLTNKGQYKGTHLSMYDTITGIGDESIQISYDKYIRWDKLDYGYSRYKQDRATDLLTSFFELIIPYLIIKEI